MNKLAKKQLRFDNYFGAKIETPMYYLGGKRGNHALIQGGIHGGETTYLIFKELIKVLKKQRVTGSLLLIPIANPLAWLQRQYFYTTGKFNLYNGKDWNRHFPSGKKTTDPAQVITKNLSNHALKADLVIDLHTTRKSIPFTIFNNKQQKALIKTVGAKYNFLIGNQYKNKVENLPLTVATGRKKIDSFAIECGSQDEIKKKNIESALRMIINALVYKKILARSLKVEGQGSVNIFNRYLTYYCPKTGFVEYRKEPGENYQKGELLYLLHPYNNLRKTIKVHAEERGIIIKKAPTHILWKGDEVLQNVRFKNLIRI